MSIWARLFSSPESDAKTRLPSATLTGSLIIFGRHRRCTPCGSSYVDLTGGRENPRCPNCEKAMISAIDG